MISKVETRKTDDEYQYPNEEYVAETTPVAEKVATPKTEHFLIRLIRTNKRVTAIIAIAVVALIAFKWMAWHNKHSMVPVKPAAIPAPVVETPSPQVLSQLVDLKQAQENNAQSINQLQS